MRTNMSNWETYLWAECKIHAKQVLDGGCLENSVGKIKVLLCYRLTARTDTFEHAQTRLSVLFPGGDEILWLCPVSEKQMGIT